MSILLQINKNVEFITKYLSDSQIENHPQLNYDGSTDPNCPEQRLYILECMKLIDTCPEIFEYLKCYFDIYRPKVIVPEDPQLSTCLMTALIMDSSVVISVENRIKIIIFLLNYGVDINTKLNCQIDSYLNMAIVGKHNFCRYEIIKCLLDYGAKIFLDGAKNSAFHALVLIKTECYEGEIEKILNLLLEKENDINIVNHENLTLLHIASFMNFNNSVNIMKLLVGKNIDLEKKNNHLETALHLTVKKSNLELALQKIKILLDAGANINASDVVGNTLLHLAAVKYRNNVYQIINLLIKERNNELNWFSRNYFNSSLFHTLTPKVREMYNFVIIKEKVDTNNTGNCYFCSRFVKEGIKCELNHLICEACLFICAHNNCSICDNKLLFTLKVVRKEQKIEN